LIPAGKDGETVHCAGDSPVVCPPMACMVVPLVSVRRPTGKTIAIPLPGTVMFTSWVKEPPLLVAVMFTLDVF
jgi:hypothetical protein